MQWRTHFPVAAVAQAIIEFLALPLEGLNAVYSFQPGQVSALPGMVSGMRGRGPELDTTGAGALVLALVISGIFRIRFHPGPQP